MTNPIQEALADMELKFEGPWIFLSPSGSTYPRQGWKLHISATESSALTVLKKVLPILKRGNYSFKVAASLKELGKINDVNGQRSQAGKFITVYPSNEEKAISLAAELDEVTQGLEGPRIPSDRSLHPDSLIHYRFGAFTPSYLVDNEGIVTPGVFHPDGHLIPDLRLPWYSQPEWISDDPFVKAGIALKYIPEQGPIGQRYRVFECLRQASRGGIYLAEDKQTGLQVVIKEARKHIGIDRFGRDVRERLRYEFKLLDKFSSSPLTPNPYDFFEQEGNLYGVMEYIEGTSLRNHVKDLRNSGRYMFINQVVELGKEMLEIIDFFHKNNIVLRDFTPNNLIYTASGLRLVDLEGACEQEMSNHPFYVYTPGYGLKVRSNQPNMTEDLFSFGATLFLVITGHDPYLPNDHRPLISRLIELLKQIRPETPDALVNLISGCLSNQFTNVEEVRSVFKDEIPNNSGHPIELAKGVGDYICRIMKPEDPNRPWPANFGIHSVPTNIHNGTAGIGLFLKELYNATGWSHYRESAEAAGEWILNRINSPKHLQHPGLYFGDAGAAWFLWRLGWKEESKKLTKQIASLPLPSTDITHGAAGVGLLYLLVGDIEKAQATGDELLTQESNCSYYGFGHGIAGIGYFLLELFKETGKERFYNYVIKIAEKLIDAAQPLPHCSGWSWPHSANDSIIWPHWCHGASGVGLFFLRLHTESGDSIYADAAERAGLATYYGSRSGSPVQCHGIAGNAEFLLDLYQASGESMWLNRAHELARILDAMSVYRENVKLWPGDDGETLTPELMTGYSGVAAFLLRLSNPDTFKRLMEVKS
ncbi:class IV lanthionine synthetase LanL [Bacillus thuringiensis]|uniref:class IV lanthionine synthetase LanL n=1 Tax=Bacillus thuringiensis TaxID=1428 RepID=UPI002DBE0DF1|nr:class IV lanthionine synthetase LanL [Bacillus thuringiensis]MEC3225523.1 class IV lanthionine synthetase LanL [Bacillus thuringiensis]MEC3464681.1 class IV lanthionine synthetase LanL [Bacillus thuringiensis]MEC3556143.1 class IV lanthionine synthetase LanL [Bacillus thuringiensis]